MAPASVVCDTTTEAPLPALLLLPLVDAIVAKLDQHSWR